MLINHWHYRPKMHGPDPHAEKKLSWFELFYDRVYVAAIIQLGNSLSHHSGWMGFLVFRVLGPFDEKRPSSPSSRPECRMTARTPWILSTSS